MSVRILGTLFPLIMALAPLTSQAQTAEMPQTTSASYKDWTVRCEMIADAPPRKVCEVAQAVRANDGQNVLAQIVIGQPQPDVPYKLIVQLPAGVWLPADTTLRLADGREQAAEFNRCLQICVADTDLNAEMVTGLKAATEPAVLRFQDGNRQTIELPISLQGFTAAINAAQP